MKLPWIERRFFLQKPTIQPRRRPTGLRRALGVEQFEDRRLLTVIITGDGSGNTSPPPDDPGFNNVGVRGSGSAVYLGGGWVLTDVHVGAGNTLFNNVWYTAVDGSSIQLTNPKGAGFTTGTDLMLYKINGDPGLPSLNIGSAAPAVGWSVIMIGYGRDRTASEAFWDSNWNPATSASPYAGYIWTGNQHMRWGTNTISAINMPLGISSNSENSFMTLFTGTTPYDGQGAPGDSGGGVFYKDASGNWNLIGLMAAVTTTGNQPWGTSVLGNATYIADLSVYRSQILAAMNATTSVNHAPAGTDKTIATAEDTAYTFAASDFGFSDPNDSPANNFLAVQLTTLPAAGTIADGGIAVNAGQLVPVSDINAGKLKFTPAVNANGTSYASFTFQVEDDGGTAGGGANLDPTPNTITINVTSVNDAPSGASSTITTLEDTPYAFVASDFGFSDPSDSPPNNFLAVKLTTLPAAGTIADGGVAVTAGQLISVADVNAGKLKFTPAANANGTSYTSFTFQVEDDGGTASGGVNLDPTPNTITINVTSVNDAPSGFSSTIATLEDTPYVFAASDFGFSDPNDSPPNNFLAVKLTTLPAAGTIADGGVAVTLGVFISVADVNAGKLVFTPAANANGSPYASFTFQVEDDGGTAGGGVNLDPTPNTITLNVTAVNDAPIGQNKSISTVESTPYVFAASDFGFSDPNDSPPNNFLAVKLTTLPAAGTIADNGVAVVTGQLIAIADITAGKLKYTPAAGANGSPYASFTFQVEDDGGTASGGVNLDPTPNTFTISVTAVNDAPVGQNKSITTLEDKPYVFAASDFGFSDPNDSPPNNFLAVKLTTLPAAGTIADNGAAVVVGQLISVADLNAGKLVYTPAANASGTPYATFTFQVEDDGGTASGGVNLDPTPNTITFNVTPVNDAPAGQDKSLTLSASTSYTFAVSDFGFSDLNDSPANNFLAVKLTTLPAAGTITNGGKAVAAGQLITVADITAGKLKFTPVVGASGTPYASFTFQVEDDGGTASGGVNLDPTPNTITLNVTPPVQGTNYSLWPASATPGTVDGGDAKATELGVKFTVSADGFITGIRYYKSATNTGTHTGSLWSASGQLLATATFTGEGASGWQQVNFSTPVAVTAGATYTASYHTTVGHYSVSRSYFSSPTVSGPLTATTGVYLYGAGGFPTTSYQASNYWVDVVFSTTAPADTTPPTIAAILPSSNATGVATTVAPTVTFSEAMNPATINSNTVQLLAGSTVVTANVTYNANSNTATITPAAGLTSSTTYTVRVIGGAGGVQDTAGNSLAATANSSFTTAATAAQVSTYSLWSPSATPGTIDGGDAKATELGVKFTVSTSGYITGIKFYKSAANTGPHTGSLWSASGQLLATATFSGEGGTGWQVVSFSTPIAVTAGATYTASYHTTVGHYSVSRSYFSSPTFSGPLTATTGVYLYGAGGFPTASYQASNYWVDVVFSTSAPTNVSTPPTFTAFSPAVNASAVATSVAPTITFSEAMNPATINSSTVQLLNGSTVVAATVSYSAGTNTATITPSAALANATTYTIRVLGGAGVVQDLAGDPLATTASSSFTTAIALAQSAPTSSLWPTNLAPATADSGDTQAAELGVKFTVSTDGYITGIRFYKSAGNTGAHTGSLWTASGQLLATATFTSESASGWQEVDFSTPIAVTAGTTYVASYHTSVGHYAVTRSFFSSPLVSGPLTATSGVYLYGAGGFPTASYQASNYWVDVVFSTTV